MRILYCAGNRVGANSQLFRFLASLPSTHEVKVAAFVKSSHSLIHIDWTLDSLYNNVLHRRHGRVLQSLLCHPEPPLVNLKNTEVFIKEAKDFCPDLVISDGDTVSPFVARAIGSQLWYCSPLNLLMGISWDFGVLKYKSFIAKEYKKLWRLPDPDRMLIYSPFGDVDFRPQLKTGYEWVRPYYSNKSPSDKNYKCIFVINEFERFAALTKLINVLSIKTALVSPYTEEFNNIDRFLDSDNKVYSELLFNCEKIFTTGETSYIADALYNNKNICIAPTLTDTETLLNASLIKEYSFGTNLGQVELMDMYALDKIEECLERPNTEIKLSKQNLPYLHELIV